MIALKDEKALVEIEAASRDCEEVLSPMHYTATIEIYVYKHICMYVCMNAYMCNVIIIIIRYEYMYDCMRMLYLQDSSFVHFININLCMYVCKKELIN